MSTDWLATFAPLLAWLVLPLLCVAGPILRFIQRRRHRLRPLAPYPAGIPPKRAQPFPTLATRPSPVDRYSGPSWIIVRPTSLSVAPPDDS